MRVDIEIDYETLRWAAIQAVSLGISRRKFLFNCIEKVKNSGPNIEFLIPDKDYIPQHIGRSSTGTPPDILPVITSANQYNYGKEDGK